MNATRGILLFLISIAVFSVMGGLVKAADRIPAGEAVFFRSICALPIIAIWLGFRGDLKTGLQTTNIKSHFYRSIFGTMAMGLGFAGLKYLPFPEVTALRFITPVLIVVFAALILGEKFRLVRLFAVCLGLIGVTIILWPRLSSGSVDPSNTELFGAILILTSAVFASLAQIFIKRMATVEKTAAIVFYFSITSMALSLLSIPFGWVWPEGREWAFLIGAGVVGGTGQIFLTSSYQYAEAGVLAPFAYTSMLWSLLIGFFVFAEVPSLMMLGGAMLVISSGGVIVWRERQIRQGKTALRKVTQPE